MLSKSYLAPKYVVLQKRNMFLSDIFLFDQHFLHFLQKFLMSENNQTKTKQTNQPEKSHALFV